MVVWPCRRAGLRLRVTKQWKTAWAIKRVSQRATMVMEVMVAVPKGDRFVEPLIGQSDGESRLLLSVAKLAPRLLADLL